MITLCCKQLEALLSNAGDRGLAVIVIRVGAVAKIAWQSRVAAFTDEARFLALLRSNPPRELQVNLQWERAIRFCPFCAADLDIWLANSDQKEVEAIADAHQKYRLGTHKSI